MNATSTRGRWITENGIELIVLLFFFLLLLFTQLHCASHTVRQHGFFLKA